MTEFWLDSSAYIEPRKRHYPFDVVPGYWSLLEQKAFSGMIKSPRLVWTEIVDNSTLPDGSRHDLAQWLMGRESALIVEPGQAVQQAFTQIADYVSGSYEQLKGKPFLSGADPWVIAHALADSGKVVSMEIREPPSKRAKSAKIPDVCDKFGVRHIDPVQMLRELGVTLILG